MNKLAIIGASGHGKVLADIAKKNGYDEIVFLDDDEKKTTCGGYPVEGTSRSIYDMQCDAIVGIGNASIRKRITQELIERGIKVVTLIHPSAVIGENVSIGIGTVIVAGAVVNSGAKIGNGCIINTCASVDHDCKIEDYVHIAVGAHLSGTVEIGEKTWIGIGAVISNNLTICGDSIVGAGAVVVQNIMEKGTYVGVPARRIK